MFVAILNYVRPLKEIDALMRKHVAFLERHYKSGLFLASGRQVPRSGGVILIRDADREHVLEVLAKDPFVTGEVAIFELIEFTPNRVAEGFEAFSKPKTSRKVARGA